MLVILLYRHSHQCLVFWHLKQLMPLFERIVIADNKTYYRITYLGRFHQSVVDMFIIQILR